MKNLKALAFIILLVNGINVLIAGSWQGDSVLVQFSEWTCDDSATYTARFFTSKDAEPIWQTREKTVTFYGEPWTGIIEDQPEVNQPTCRLINTYGTEIALSYAGYQEGFSAVVFDATGRRIDRLVSASSTATITWGESHPPGVYFIRIPDISGFSTQRVVLVN